MRKRILIVSTVKAGNGKIDIVVMDLIIRGKSSKDAYEEIRKLHAEVKVPFMSGYNSDLFQNKGFLQNNE